MLLTVKQAAEFLNVSSYTIYKWAESGVLTGRKLNGKLWRFSQDDLDGFGKVPIPPEPSLTLTKPEVADDCKVQRGQKKLVIPV